VFRHGFLPHLKIAAWLALLFVVLIQVRFFGMIGLWLGFWALVLSRSWLKRELVRSEAAVARHACTRPAPLATEGFNEDELLSHYGISKSSCDGSVIYCYGEIHYDQLAQAIGHAEWESSRQV
jgi:hypothetical protein